LAAATVVVGLGLVEGAARVVEWARARSGRPDVATAFSERFEPLRYELVPGSELPANGEVARINAAGLRGPEPDRPKRRIRVLCLGDSCTFGYAPGVTDDATYPAALARKLDAGRFEVINGGMPGFGSLDCLDFLLYKGLEWEPDVVVILAGWNDHSHVHHVANRPTSAGPLDWLGGSALVRLGKLVVAKIAGPPSARFDPARERARLARLPGPNGQLSEAAFARTGRVIEEVVRICRAHQAQPILVTYPNFTRSEWDGVDSLTDAELHPALSALAEIELSPKGWRTFAATTNELIRGVSKQLDVPLVEGDAIRDAGLFFDLIHLGREGCAILAERVAPAVVHATKQALAP
jgi:lysophospholipase L1-like esterase